MGSKFPISFEEIVKSACERNVQVKRYVGDKYKLEYNIKLRPILQLLLNDSHIIQTNLKPVALQWTETGRNTDCNSLLSDGSDASDTGAYGTNEKTLSKKEEIEDKSVKSTSVTSDTSDRRYISNDKYPTTINTQAPSSIRKPIVPVDEFFDDYPNGPWEPLSPHDLEQSPYYPIISKKGELYRCNVHPKEQNIYLETIEHHCKYKDPELHKSEIVRLTSTNATTAEAAAAEAARNNILYAAFQVSQKQAFHNSRNRI
jgi:hypothetical protein